MPIFEFTCRRCEHKFETIVLSSRGKITCPECACKAVEKQLSVFSARGSGNDAADASAAGCH